MIHKFLVSVQATGTLKYSCLYVIQSVLFIIFYTEKWSLILKGYFQILTIGLLRICPKQIIIIFAMFYLQICPQHHFL